MNPMLLSLVGQKLNLASLVQEYPGLMKLGHLMSLRANQLTVEHLQEIAGALNTDIPMTSEVQAAVVQFLKGKDIDAVCDLIQSPESVRDVVTFFKGGFKELREYRVPEPKSIEQVPTDAFYFL